MQAFILFQTILPIMVKLVNSYMMKDLDSTGCTIDIAIEFFYKGEKFPFKLSLESINLND
jgi:hypothetical protein